MIYDFTRPFPTEERYGLISQMRRAAVSIPANIAEGQARQSTGEFRQFLGIARGSLAELETLIVLSNSLDYATPESVAPLLSGCEEISKLLSGLLKSLSTRHYSQVEVCGWDYFNPRTGVIESGGADKIAMWMLDTDYDGRSLYPSQVFFPMAGEKDGWARLAKNLKAEIDEELIEAYRGTVSLPFEVGKHGRAAVKIIDDRGIESLKVVPVG